MGLKQTRPYVVYDKVTGSFLSDYNEANPILSHWQGFTEESCFISDEVDAFDKKTVTKVLTSLTEVFKEEEGGADFVALRVAPKIVYLLDPWPEYVEPPR